MQITAILTFLEKYWEPIALAIIIATLFGSGFHYGSKNAENSCKIELAVINKASQDAHDALQAKADQLAAESAKLRSESTAKALTIQKRLKHELSKNPDYSKCVVSDSLLQIYRDTASPSGQSTR